MVFSSAMTFERSCNQGIIVKHRSLYFETFISELMNSFGVTCSKRNDPLKINGSQSYFTCYLFTLSAILKTLQGSEAYEFSELNNSI